VNWGLISEEISEWKRNVCLHSWRRQTMRSTKKGTYIEFYLSIVKFSARYKGWLVKNVCCWHGRNAHFVLQRNWVKGWRYGRSFGGVWVGTWFESFQEFLMMLMMIFMSFCFRMQPKWSNLVRLSIRNNMDHTLSCQTIHIPRSHQSTVNIYFKNQKFSKLYSKFIKDTKKKSQKKERKEKFF